MLNRNNLAKQFELVVQQEIKNHNDQIAASNSALNELKKSDAALNDKVDLIAGALGSEITNSNIRLSNLSDQVLKLSGILNRHINDLENHNIKQNEFLKDIVDNALETKCKHEKSEALRHLMHDRILDLEDSLQNVIHNFSRQLEEKHQIFDEKLCNLKQEIESKPSEALEVKEVLEKRMSEKEIDTKGVQQEIERLKRSHYVLEKKIENIYTLLERINKRLSQ